MARNGSGVFSIVNPIQIGALRSSTAVNTNCTDMGDEITNTLPLNGTAAMTGQFKAAVGTASAPGISFNSDRNLGLRRASADEMRWVAGGSDRFYIDANGKAWHLGNMNIAGAVNFHGAFTSTDDALFSLKLEALTGTGLSRQIEDDDEEEQPLLDDGTTVIPFRRDAMGNVIATGVLTDIYVPFACTIVSATLFGDVTGSVVIEIWKDSYANYPPTIADKITGSSPLTISSGVKSEDTTLSGWTTAISAGDVLRYNINSITAFTRLDIELVVKRYA